MTPLCSSPSRQTAARPPRSSLLLPSACSGLLCCTADTHGGGSSQLQGGNECQVCTTTEWQASLNSKPTGLGGCGCKGCKSPGSRPMGSRHGSPLRVPTAAETLGRENPLHTSTCSTSLLLHRGACVAGTLPSAISRLVHSAETAC